MSMQSPQSENWLTRMWRILIAWDEAINTSPNEQLERRVAALELEVRAIYERTSIPTDTKISQAIGRHANA